MNKLKNTAIILSLIIAVGIFTRFVNIDSHSIYIDETWVVPTTNFHYDQDSIYPKLFDYPEYRTLSPKLQKLIKDIYNFHPLFQVAAIRAASDVHPPLFFFFNYYWSKWFGYDIGTVRTPAAIYFILTLFFLFYCLKKQEMDIKVRSIVLLIMIFTPLYLFFSNYARPYTLLLFLCLLSFYLSYLLLKNEFKKYKILYIISAVACMYTHYFGALVVASQGLYMLYESHYKKNFKEWLLKIIIIELIIAFLFLPWFFVLLLQYKTKFPHLEGKAAFVFFDFNALRDLVLFFSPGYSRGSVYSFLNWLAAFCQLFAFFVGIIYLIRQRRSESSRFWLFSFFCPFLLIIVFNTITPVFTVRNCAIVLIPYLTICGIGLANLKVFHLKTGILLFLLLVGSYFTLYGVSVGDAKAGRTVESWKAVAEYINSIENCPTVYVHHSSYRDGLFYYIKDLNKIKGLAEKATVTGPQDKDYILIVVNHNSQSIREKLNRELLFLKQDKHIHINLLEKIAETYIYKVAGS